MKVLQFILYAVISFGFSVTFFDVSVLATTIIFCVLTSVVIKPNETYFSQKKMSKHVYGTSIVTSIIGAILIIVGKKIVNMDVLIIIGAILFAPTMSAMLIMQLHSWFNKLKKYTNSR